jgi:NADPH:quinone reductase-like Zn-dependent oxidoreductase
VSDLVTDQESMMRAVVQYEYGSADVLDLVEIAKPDIGDDEVLVSVRAAGIHIGDEVFGWCTGAFAEYVAVSEDALATMPTNVTFEQAAAVPVSGFTALQAARDKGELQAGHKVLIVGASGGVGTFAVQIAKSLGAEVSGVASTRNLEMVRSIGADHVIDYTQEDFTESEQRYDVIIDTAGNRSLSQLRRALTAEGTLVIVGGSGGRWLMGSGRSMGAALSSPFIGQTLRPFISTPNQQDLFRRDPGNRQDLHTRQSPGRYGLPRRQTHPREDCHHRVTEDGSRQRGLGNSHTQDPPTPAHSGTYAHLRRHA